MGKPMVNTGSYTRVTKAGYVQEYTRYEVESCKWCGLRQVCHGQKGNRVIEVNHNLRRLKGKANKRLKTPKGINNVNKDALTWNPCLPVSSIITSSSVLCSGESKNGSRNRFTCPGTQSLKESSLTQGGFFHFPKSTIKN